MRFILAFVFLVLSNLSYLHAQQDTIYITTDSSDIQQFKKVKRYKYIDQNLLRRRTLYKFGLHINSFENRDRLSVEHKIWPSFSAEVGILLPRSEYMGVYGQLRYYPSKRAGAPESVKKVDNFNGHYFSVEANRGFEIDVNRNETNVTAQEESKGVYSLGVGSQQKVGNWGFFDLSANLRYVQALDQVRFGLKFMTGLAYGKSFVEEQYFTDKFEAFKSSYRKERQLFKLQDPGLNIGPEFSSGTLSFGYERMLFQNFTINNRLSFYGSSFKSSNGYRAYGSTLSSELRYYYNFNKRMRLGHNPRSFSGHHVSLGVNNLFAFQRTRSDVERSSPAFRDLNGFDLAILQVGWGTQQRIGKRVFFDLGISLIYSTYDNALDYQFNSSLGITLGK